MSTSSSIRCSQFSIQEIEAATNQFNSKILGRGGEATVYLADIYIDSKKTFVAVKRLKESSSEFETEIHTLSKIQHPYLVSLLGYCNESGHQILVYEYMEKGCLSDYLKKGSHIPLSWQQRLTICLGAARGLQCLHKETDEFPKGIIHRDVKPGNILVSENWVGKLSDFGMFKLSYAGQDKSLMTTNLKGTSGYYAPEYIKYGRITRKIDVYAFGVVLFQVLCRKMPWDRDDESYYANDNEDLGLWAQQNVDTQIKGEMCGESLMVFTGIVGRSLQADPGRRPTMDDVVLDLQKALEGSTGFHPKTPRCCQFSVEEIKAATNQFDSSKIISQDGEANVYLADICIGLNKTPVAVKLLKDNCKEFERQINVLSNIQHPNLVSLLGYCNESGHQILVYEYMANGSLSDYLNKRSNISLSYQQRLIICLSAARGLQHLHTETHEFPNGIVHGDMKPGNILVDKNWVGKIFNIGMIKLADAGQENSVTDTILKGNRAYSPQKERKVDVHAFGMVLLEVLSMVSPMDMENAMYYVAGHDQDTALWAIQTCFDSQSKRDTSEDSVKMVTSIIYKILRGNEKSTMDAVVLDLQKALECQDSKKAN